MTGQYGTSGLSATALKAWFDQLAKYIASKVNETNEVFASKSAAEYIRICLDEYNVESLGDLILTFQDGSFADKILLVAKNAGEAEKESLQTVLNSFAESLSKNDEKFIELNNAFGTLSGNVDAMSVSLSALKEKVDNLQLDGGSVIVDNKVTETGQNPVTSAAIVEYVQDLLYEAIKITSFTASKSTFEVSASGTESVVLNWSLSRNPTMQTLQGSTVATELRTKTGSVSLTSMGSENFTLTVKDSKGNADSKTVSVSVYNRIYYGALAKPTSYTDSWIKSLTGTLSNSRSKSFSVTAGTGQYIYYALPTRLGYCSFNIDGFVGGFEMVGTYSVTNKSGYTENYYLYKSVEENLGKTTVIVS